MKDAAPTTKPEKVKKPKSKGRKIAEWVLLGIFGSLCALVLAANIQGAVTRDQHYGQSIRFGVGSFIVLTTSMEPDIKQNDAIITYAQDVSTFPERLARGETIDITFVNVSIGYTIEPDTPQFKRENGGRNVVTNQVMTHRLMEIHVDESIAMGKGRYLFITAGINHQGDYSLMGQYQLFTEAEYLGVVVMNNAFLGQFFNFIISPLGLILLLLVPAVYLIISSSIDIFKTLKASEETNQAPPPSEGGRLSTISDAERERLKKELMDELIKSKKGGGDHEN